MTPLQKRLNQTQPVYPRGLLARLTRRTSIQLQPQSPSLQTRLQQSSALKRANA